MSLLDDASLLLTPNAYKEGKLYSVIPSNGNGDFTATRATTATRVNSAGLVDLVPYNLLSYSDMFSNAAWTKNNSTISANVTTAPDGTLTADKLVETNATGVHNIVSILTPSIINYTASFYAKKAERNFVYFAFGGASWGGFGFMVNLTTGEVTLNTTGSTPIVTALSDGWFKIEATRAATTAVQIQYQVFTGLNSTTLNYAGDGTSGIFIWGAQLVEGTSARDYLRTETRLNIPRIDYSLGGCPNILLEPQRTNLALQSSSFDNATWAKLGATTPIVTANTAISPSGVMDADRLQFANIASAALVYQSLSHTSGQQITVSVYAKRNAATDQLFRLFGDGGSSISNILTATSEWQRFTYTFTASTTGGRTMGIYNVPNFASDLQIWGYQFEVGAYATSYIPTTTASVTRNADSITRNNIFTNGLITASGGTWFVELRNNVDLIRAGSSGGIFINTGTVALGGSGFLFRNPTSSSQKISIVKYISGTALTLYDTLTTNVKAAIKWNGSTADVFVNGVKEVSATAFSITAMENLIAEGNNRNLHINEMALFPTPLTDAQCIALTQ